jgi:hypothetical protein
LPNKQENFLKANAFCLIPIRWLDEPHRFGEIIFGQQLNLNRCFFIHGRMVDPGLAFSEADIESTSAIAVALRRKDSEIFQTKNYAAIAPSTPANVLAAYCSISEYAHIVDNAHAHLHMNDR